MKKQICILSFMALLFSCSDEVGQYEALVDSQMIDNDGTKTRSLDTDDHALGFSYDVTGDYLDKYSIRNAVVDVVKLREYDKNSVIISNEVNGKNQYYYGYSSYDYIKEITEKVGVDVSGGNDSKSVDGDSNDKKLSFTGTFSTTKFSRYALSTKYSYASADICKDVRWLHFAENINVLSDFLTEKFKRDVANMSSPDQFVKDYGTHVLADITIGGGFFVSCIVRALSKKIIETLKQML